MRGHPLPGVGLLGVPVPVPGVPRHGALRAGAAVQRGQLQLPAPGRGGGGRYGPGAEGGQGQPPALPPAQPLARAGPHHRPRHLHCPPRHRLRRPNKEDPPPPGAGGE